LTVPDYVLLFPLFEFLDLLLSGKDLLPPNLFFFEDLNSDLVTFPFLDDVLLVLHIQLILDLLLSDPLDLPYSPSILLKLPLGLGHPSLQLL